jgi:hypothetical protein
MTYTRKTPPKLLAAMPTFGRLVLHGANSYILSKRYKTFYEFFFCQAVGFSVYKSPYAECRYRNCIASFVTLGVTGGFHRTP